MSDEAVGKKVRSIEDTTDETTKTTAKDITALRQAIFGDKIGLNSNVRFRCKECGADESMVLPMNENFFSVS